MRVLVVDKVEHRPDGFANVTVRDATFWEWLKFNLWGRWRPWIVLRKHVSQDDVRRMHSRP